MNQFFTSNVMLIKTVSYTTKELKVNQQLLFKVLLCSP